MKINQSISVILPAYNAEDFLDECMQSIFNQAIEPEEILLINNCSTDRTAEIAQRYGAPVKYMVCERPGAAAARNMAVQVAQGEWLAFMDADDLWAADTLALYVAAVEAHPHVDIVYGQVKNFKDKPQITGGFTEKVPKAVPLPAAMLIRRTAFDQVGLYREDYQVGCVIEWALRAQEKTLNWIELPDVVLHRRIHETNMTKRNRDHKTDYARIVKAALDRRRQNSKSE